MFCHSGFAAHLAGAQKTPYLSFAELDAMMKEVDTDGSGDIDFHEFVTVMSRRVQADYTPEQLKVCITPLQFLIS